MNPINRNRSLIGLALLCAGAFTANGAMAASPDPSEVSTLSVRYQQTDLVQPDGPKHLYARIRAAASVACHEPDTRELRQYASYRRCYERAVDSAVRDIGASQLTAVHRSRTERVTAS